MRKKARLKKRATRQPTAKTKRRKAAGRAAKPKRTALTRAFSAVTLPLEALRPATTSVADEVMNAVAALAHVPRERVKPTSDLKWDLGLGTTSLEVLALPISNIRRARGKQPVGPSVTAKAKTVQDLVDIAEAP